MGYNIVPCHPLELIRTSSLILPYPSPSFCSLPLFSLFLILLSSSTVLLQPPLFLSVLSFHSQFPFYSKNLALLLMFDLTFPRVLWIPQLLTCAHAYSNTVRTLQLRRRRFEYRPVYDLCTAVMTTRPR